MKVVKFTVLILTIALFAPQAVLGQRKVDLMVDDIVTPERVDYGKSIATSFVIKNNGPDMIKEGDTLIFMLRLAGTPTGEANRLVGKDMEVGDTMLVSASINPVQWAGASFEGAFCARAAVLNRSETDSIVWEVNQPTFTDNERCEDIDFIDSHGWGVSIEDGEITWYTQELEVYPNPANLQFTVSYFNPDFGKTSIQVLDISGRVVYEIVEDATPTGDQENIISTSGLTPGVYTVRLSTVNHTTTQKILVTR
ncbi:MAG: T9SS type A sorting domain-containing protein [Bacteroidia bacterium]|nr:T9SS type A sorting domain-containing protein [Bacteroidia bacterium]